MGRVHEKRQMPARSWCLWQSWGSYECTCEHNKWVPEYNASEEKNNWKYSDERVVRDSRQIHEWAPERREGAFKIEGGFRIKEGCLPRITITIHVACNLCDCTTRKGLGKIAIQWRKADRFQRILCYGWPLAPQARTRTLSGVQGVQRQHVTSLLIVQIP